MGNGSSQSMALGHHQHSRTMGTNSSSLYQQNRYQRTPPKYAHPHNRVLPNPVAGQRLRSTDNGHILHSAGTIRGLKPGSPLPAEMDEGDPEVMDILKRRSEIIEKDQENQYQPNLRNQRMFYSDPDISRTKQTSSYSPEVPENGTGNRRISGGAAARANKLKQKKKSRAPEPPPALGDNYHGHFQRRAQSSNDLTASKQQGGQDCKCVIPEWKPKNRAPPPPPAPPEPPPMPTFAAQNRLYSKDSTSFERSWNSGKTVPGDRNRSSGNSVSPHRKEPIRSENQRDKPFSDNRTTVFNSKADLSMNNSKKPALLQQRPDPFQKEIEEVTKKIAQNRSMNGEVNSGDQPKDVRKTNAPKQYYFSDKDLCKPDKKPPKPRDEEKQPHQDITRMTESHTPNSFKSEDESVQRKQHQKQHSDAIVKPKEKDLSSRGDFHLQRFPPIRRQFKDSGNASLDEEEDRRMLMNGDSREDLLQNEEKSDIDLRLRPVLPRKTPQLPKFSPIEAWQALGSDGRGSSNQSTSDESIQRYLLQANRIYSKKESRRFYDYKDSRSSYNCTPSDSQWTPRQDLNDSEDSSSLASEEVVVPKSRMSEFPTRFSLPTIMFSNVRPIGTEMTSGKRNSLGAVTSYYDRDDDVHVNHRKKPGKFDSSQRFKRLLGIRNKYLSEEDISFSDSNWTFGGHGLQHHKRGKQYSSELMLSDKRKYEIMSRNNYGGFVEDVMVVPKKSPIKDSFILEDSGNPNFSFYSTDGHVMYLPPNETDSKMYPNAKPGRNNHGNRRKANKIDQNDHIPKSMKKSSAGYEVELERAKRSSLDVARMLEDEVRRKRNKEKIAIRQQLRMIKQMDSDNDDDDSDEEVDEAYFTEPKSLEGSSPLHLPSLELPYHLEEMPPRYDRKRRDEGPPSRGGGDYTKPLMHWKSSPALLDDQSSKPYSNQNGFNSCSSVTSSPDPVLWQQQQQQPGPADKRTQRKQQSHVRRIIGKHRRTSDGDNSSEHRRSSMDGTETPSPAEPEKVTSKDKKATTSIYKQLMDIVRREERYLKKSEGREFNHGSRESSYSQRESSHSSSSHDSVSSSSNSFSDSSSSPVHDEPGKSGVPANNEFHSATGLDQASNRPNNGNNIARHEFIVQARQIKPPQPSPSTAAALHTVLVQPYSPNKSYRPIHFEVKASPNSCRVPILQDNHKTQAEVS